MDVMAAGENGDEQQRADAGSEGDASGEEEQSWGEEEEEFEEYSDEEEEDFEGWDESSSSESDGNGEWRKHMTPERRHDLKLSEKIYRAAEDGAGAEIIAELLARFGDRRILWHECWDVRAGLPPLSPFADAPGISYDPVSGFSGPVPVPPGACLPL